jgi:hypothetical protein
MHFDKMIKLVNLTCVRGIILNRTGYACVIVFSKNRKEKINQNLINN